MKHRTVTVFIMLLASLAATPGAIQQLTSLRDAAGQRLNAGIWSVFMSVSGQRAVNASRSQALPAATDAPAVTELASARAARPSKAEPRAARAEERTATSEHETAAPESFGFKFDGKELAALGRLEELKKVEWGGDGRLLVRAPEVPVRLEVTAPLPPAPYSVKVVKDSGAYVYGLNEALKGLEVRRLQQLDERRLQKELTRKAAAVRAESAVRAVEWHAETPCPTRSTSSSVLNCEGEDEVEELMN